MPNASGLFNRSTGAQAYRDIIKAIIDAVDTTNTAIKINLQQPNHLTSKFSLLQNYPNPFNPLTNISFSLSSGAYVSLKIFDILGKEVATIVSAEMQPGSYTRIWDASSVSSGVYICRLQAGSIAESKKLILLQ